MKKSLYHIFVLFIPFIGFTTGCGVKAEKENKKKSSDPLKVELIEVQKLHPRKNIILPGELKPWEKVDLFPKVKGFVKTVTADRGTIVSIGQTLAVLEAPEVWAELEHASSEYHGALASLEESKNKLKASKSLYSRLQQTSKTAGAVSASELEQIHSKMMIDSAALATTQHRVNSTKESYNIKKHLTDYLTIKSPINGVVMERNINSGVLVSPDVNGQKPMFVVVNSSKLRLTVAVPEIYSNSIQPHNEISFSVNSLPDQVFKAKYSRSAENIDNSVRVMMTEFDVLNGKYLLKAGMYAEVKIPTQRDNPTFFLPSKSVITSSEKVFVIKDNNGFAEWLEVKKGNTVDTLTEVFGDLKAGDKIVKKASDEIRDGQAISH